MPKMVLIGSGVGLVKGVIYMVTWKFKSCPRCGGDLFLDRDIDSWYEQCLQCSYRNDLRNILDTPQQLGRKQKEPVRARGPRLKH